MENQTTKLGRRALLKSAAAAAVAATAATRAGAQAPAAEPVTTLTDVPLAAGTTVTVERRGQVVLVGLNRPSIQNRIDPPTRLRLGEVLYQYEHDPSLRALVLFGHGPNFSRGIDVDASQAGIISGRRETSPAPTLDLNGNSQPRRTKPMVVVVHGDTWNLGHEIYLAGDIRIAAADTRFGQDENTHGRFPGGGATVRFVREAGWGNAMRYMLTGDHWSAEESYRMGVTQQIAPTRGCRAGRRRGDGKQDRRVRPARRSRRRSRPRISTSIPWRPMRCRNSVPSTARSIAPRTSSRAGRPRRRAARRGTRGSDRNSELRAQKSELQMAIRDCRLAISNGQSF